MPKYCTAPNCKNDSGNTDSDRRSFYKFPLHDPERLQQWLKNMDCEDWIPSRHQYICHEHFTSSCYKLRWGIRYLESNAVPTVFQLPEKRKGVDHCERRSKRLRLSRKPRMTSFDDGMPASDPIGQASNGNIMQLYEITLNPSPSGEPMLVETSDTSHTADALPSALPLSALQAVREMEGAFPLTLCQTVEDVGGLDGGEQAEVVVVSECLSVDEQDEMVSGITAALLTEGQDLLVHDPSADRNVEARTLVVENVAPEMEEPFATYDDHGAQVIAYFETIPNILSNGGGSAQFSMTPDTVLSSALSSKPIVSTLPIVSKHTPPSPGSLILTLERLETLGEEWERDAPEEDSKEQQHGSQLEEHRYHKNSLSKEQLEAIVVELQKKVKVLQQRHRRHLDKLLGLESTVCQLRQSNLLNEERLQLLERAYIQTSAAVSDAGETVAIIYEEDNTAYLYAQSNMEEEEG